MNSKQTAKSYDQLASHWASNEFNRLNGIPAHKLALQFLESPEIALDVGCGSSGRFIDFLQSHQLEVEGLDLSREMIRLAKERHPNVLFHHVDIIDWEFSKPYDFISAWDSIWHVPLAEQPSVIRKLCDNLTSGGVLLFSAGGLHKAEERTNLCAGFDVPLYHATLGIPKLLQIIDESKCVCRHLEFDQWPESHLCLIAQKN